MFRIGKSVRVDLIGMPGLALFGSLIAPAATGQMLTGVTMPIGIGDAGTEANAETKKASISDDGRYVAFESLADNLVAGDTNGARDVFLLDRLTRRLVRWSQNEAGEQGDGASDYPDLSPDARLLAFDSLASNLVADDDNGAQDVFFVDLETGAVQLVSVSSDGVQGNGDSARPEMSADGRFVAFRSAASNLVPDDTNDTFDVFVRDLVERTTTRVSVGNLGEQGNGQSGYYGNPISRDGGVVAFSSDASNFVADDTNGVPDVFVHDIQTGETLRVSVSSDGGQGSSGSHLPGMSPDARGRFITFLSVASNLVPDDRNREPDGFMHDRDLGLTYRVSSRDDGVESNGIGGRPSVSANGRMVAFASSADNLVEGDTNGWRDVFYKDRMTGLIWLASVDNSGGLGDDNSDTPLMTPDGRFLSFESEATNFAGSNLNPGWDLLLRDRFGSLCRGMVPTYVGTTGDDVLESSSAPVVIHGLSGNDRIIGRAAGDVLCGGADNDELHASNSRALLDGGDGDDRLLGGAGPDTLIGGRGVDDCDGADGTDRAYACETLMNVP